MANVHVLHNCHIKLHIGLPSARPSFSMSHFCNFHQRFQLPRRRRSIFITFRRTVWISKDQATKSNPFFASRRQIRIVLAEIELTEAVPVTGCVSCIAERFNEWKKSEIAGIHVHASRLIREIQPTVKIDRFSSLPAAPSESL